MSEENPGPKDHVTPDLVKKLTKFLTDQLESAWSAGFDAGLERVAIHPDYEDPDDAWRRGYKLGFVEGQQEYYEGMEGLE